MIQKECQKDLDARGEQLLLSVVVPVHNEASNIGPLVSEIREALEGRLNYELVYVNDGSTDDTLKELRDMARGFRKLRIVSHDRCYGQSAAIWSGVKRARGAWIATLDGDGQNDPRDIVNIIDSRGGLGAMEPDLVICGHRKARRDHWTKRVSSRIANFVRKSLLRDGTPDTGCGLKIFPKELFLSLPFFDHMHRFLPALFLSLGARVESQVVNHRPRQSGKTHYGIQNRLWVGIVDLFGVMWLCRRIKNPLAKEEDS